MDINCDLVYQKFRYLITVSSYIVELYENLKTNQLFNNTDFTIHGGFNFIKIMNPNKIIDISSQLKNMKNNCDMLMALYTNDIDIVCKDQQNMILFIINLLNNFYTNTVTFDDTVSAFEFNSKFNELILSRPKNLSQEYQILGNYLKYTICSLNNIDYEDYNYTYNVTNINPLTNDIKSYFNLGELMFFELNIQSKTKETGGFYHNLFDIHIAKGNIASVYDTFKQANPIELIIYEMQFYQDDLINRNIGSLGDLSDADIIYIQNILKYDYNDKIFKNDYSLEITISDIFDKNTEHIYLIDQLVKNDKKIKIRIIRILFCLNMLANGFVNEIIFPINNFNYADVNVHKKILHFYRFYIRMAIFLQLDLFYIDNAGIIHTKNTAPDPGVFVGNVRRLMAYGNISRIFPKIESNVKTYINNVNQYYTDILYVSPRSPSYGPLYYNIIETLYGAQTNPQSSLTQDFKTHINNYITELVTLDKTLNGINRYTGIYYIEIMRYLQNKIYGNTDDNTQNTSIQNDISEIFKISNILSIKYNNRLFTESKTDYLYVFRYENTMDFGNGNNYLTLPLNTEFVHPNIMSTGISRGREIGKKNIILRIKLNARSIFCMIFTYSQHPHEKEILIPYGTIFKLVNRQYIMENYRKYLIDLEVVGNVNIDKCENFIEYYRNTIIGNKIYFRITTDNVLICDMENVENYITRLYDAIYSKTIPMLFDKNNIQKIIKGYLFRKKINNAIYNSVYSFAHPLNIELKLLELTKNILNLESPLTEHLINSYGKVFDCNMGPFVLYVHKKLCNKQSLKDKLVNNSWLCREYPLKDDYFEKMVFVSLEFADVGTLTTILDQHKLIDTLHLYEIFFQLFYTLAILYSYHSFVHFDLKPDNILFTKDKNYNKTLKQRYKYTYNNNIFFVRVHEFIPKIAGYDASFYNGINNEFITTDPFRMDKVKNIKYGKVDLYLFFNLLIENKMDIHIKNLKEVDGSDNYMTKIIEIFRKHNLLLPNDDTVPTIDNLLITKKICDIDIFNFLPTENIVIMGDFSFSTIQPSKNLIVYPQIHSNNVMMNGLKISEKYYIKSINKLNVLRHNSNVLRIMTFNIHEWKNSLNQPNSDNMLYDIMTVFPDILCVQEELGAPTQSAMYDLFIQYYRNGPYCLADNNLKNKIYVKKNKYLNIKNIISTNIGNYTQNYDAQLRCCVSLDYRLKNGNILKINNTHLHYSNEHGEALQNISNLLEFVKRENDTDFMIIGDFNSYNRNDYMTSTLMDGFKQSKKTSPYVTLDQNGDISNRSLDKLFEVCDKLSQEGMKDIFEIYLGGTQQYEINGEILIPINTTIYGGRIDHIYINNNTQLQILGAYKLYTDSSDHSPIIVDIYDPDPTFVSEGNFKTFSEYVTHTNEPNDFRECNYDIDKTINELYNNEITKNTNKPRQHIGKTRQISQITYRYS